MKKTKQIAVERLLDVLAIAGGCCCPDCDDADDGECTDYADHDGWDVAAIRNAQKTAERLATVLNDRAAADLLFLRRIAESVISYGGKPL